MFALFTSQQASLKLVTLCLRIVSFNLIFLLGDYLAWHSKQLRVLLSSQLECLLYKKKKKKLFWQLWIIFLIIMLVCTCSSFYLKNTNKNCASKMSKIPLSCLDCFKHMESITWLAYFFSVAGVRLLCLCVQLVSDANCCAI